MPEARRRAWGAAGLALATIAMTLALVSLRGRPATDAHGFPLSFPEDRNPCSLFPAVDGRLAGWVAAWRGLRPGLTCSSFGFAADDRLEPTPATAVLAGVVIQTSALPDRLTSPDGTRRLILFDGRGSTSRVILLDMTGVEPLELMSCLECGWRDAAWIDGDRFVLAGHALYQPVGGPPRCADGAPCTFIPTLTLVSLADMTARRYRGPEVDAEDFRPWHAERPDIPPAFAR